MNSDAGSVLNVTAIVSAVVSAPWPPNAKRFLAGAVIA